MIADGKQCGARYDATVTCTLPRGKHKHGWHRNGWLVWVELKSEYAYMRGRADNEWRHLAEAFIREQVAPADVETAKYWMKRLDRRARRQERERALSNECDAAEWSAN